jgi:glycosyltransferase involved in cell wall biosynthesis
MTISPTGNGPESTLAGPNAQSQKRGRLPLGKKSDNSARLCVIRGDIQSTTGYAKATQALAILLSEHFDVVGVDLHPNPADASGPFPFPVKLDSELPSLISRQNHTPIILHYTTPDGFLYIPGAVNVGSFYWETDALPFRRQWKELVHSMDHMWAPTSFVADFVRQCGYTGPVSIVAWPHDLQPLENLTRIEPRVSGIHYVSSMTPHLQSRTTIPNRLRRTGGNIFLAVQSLAPRKGLPILLSEWRDHVCSKATKDILLLKLRFIHSSRVGDRPEEQLRSMLEDAGFRKDDPVQIAMISQDLSEKDTLSLYGAADAYVTATYGEGFGGPVAEALCHGRLVIAPRHTGMLDLLAPDYPLTISHVPVRVGLRGISDVYPHSSVWRLPNRGALRSALEKFSGLSAEDRTATLSAARSHLAAFCSTASVRSALQLAVDRIIDSEVCGK